jgi:hypothetical protein
VGRKTRPDCWEMPVTVCGDCPGSAGRPGLWKSRRCYRPCFMVEQGTKTFGVASSSVTMKDRCLSGQGVIATETSKSRGHRELFVQPLHSTSHTPLGRRAWSKDRCAAYVGTSGYSFFAPESCTSKANSLLDMNDWLGHPNPVTDRVDQSRH